MAATTVQEARQIADGWLDVYYRNVGMDAVIIEDEIREEAFGWIFFFQSQRWLETEDPEHLLIGNAPLVVTRDGQVHVTGTSGPTSDFLGRFST